MSRPTARVVSILGALLWLLTVGAVVQSSGCGVDRRDVGVGSLNPGGAGGAGGGGGAGGTVGSAACGPECAEVLCPPDDACKDYPDVLPRGSCNPDSSACATVSDCAPTWKAETRDGIACTCGADGTGCTFLGGEACTRSEACSTGNCSATDSGSNVCCAAACAANEVCAPDGSACVAAMPCTEDERRCSGAIQQHCAGGVWETLTDCGVLGCSNERGGCLRSAGQACEVDAECGEGTCLATADGISVCCTAACGTSCRRCAASGTACDDIDDDEACGTIECPTDGCRIYDPPSVTAGRCRAGQCATPAEACTVFEPQRADLECSPTALCDSDGNCAQPKKELLAECSASPQCVSGACVATAVGTSVCCTAVCAPSEVCSPTGSCVPAPVCDDGDEQCSGSSFQTCSGGQWRTVVECGALACSVTRGGCLGGAGDSCVSDNDCGAGRCQGTSSGGSVCCTAACDGACRNCAPSGLTCENLADDTACGAIPCPADSTCRDFPFSVTSQRCVAGRCGSAAQLCTGAPRAAGQSCSATSLCDNAGNCSVPKRAIGATCVNGAECASNSCVQGVCCTGACNGICSTCAGTGICRAPATDTRCATGNCSDSPGVCEEPSVRCGNDTCVIGEALCCSELSAAGTTRVFCSAGSTCPPPPNFVPDVPISCDEHSDCDPSRVCCYSGTSTSSEVSCKRPNPTPGFDELEADFESCDPLNPMLFGDQVCESNADCPAFQSCTGANDRVPGYSFCRSN